MLTLFLYHVTVGSGDPLAEHLTRSGSRILDTEIDDGGVVENTGSARESNNTTAIVEYMSNLTVTK